MTNHQPPDFFGAMREATNNALAAIDMLARKARPGSPEIAALEAQREIILSLGRLSEMVAEVGESQSNILEAPRVKAALTQGARMGAEAGFKEVAGEMRRRTLLYGCILVAGMAALGGIGVAAGFAMGKEYEFRTLVADCLRKGVQLTPEEGRVCSVLMVGPQPPSSPQTAE